MIETEIVHKDKIQRLLAQWWKIRGGEPPAPELQSPNVAIAKFNDEIIAFNFITLTDTQTAFLAWLTADPNISPELRHEAICAVTTEGENFARCNNAKWIWIPTGHLGIVEKLKPMGYTYVKEGECMSLLKELK